MFMMVVFIIAKKEEGEGEQERKERKGKEKRKKKKGEKEQSKCPIIENWLVLMACSPENNDAVESYMIA